MKTYCNVRLAMNSEAHALSQEERSSRFARWVDTSTDQELLAAAVRGKMGVNSGGSISVALTIKSHQAERLNRLLDGKKHTLSSLARHVFSLSTPHFSQR